MYSWTEPAALLAAIMVVSPAAAQPRREAVGDAARTVGAIQPYWISAHVRALADELMEGRETATRGGWLAAKYVAAQLESYGLEPAPGAVTFL